MSHVVRVSSPSIHAVRRSGSSTGLACRSLFGPERCPERCTEPCPDGCRRCLPAGSHRACRKFFHVKTLALAETAPARGLENRGRGHAGQRIEAQDLGNIHWDTDQKTATIRVLDPADYEMPQPEMLKDMEFTVVHELIHLELASVLSPLSRNDASRREEEHAVNHMADALLKLDRGQ